MTASYLFVSLVFGLIASAIMMYGWRQKKPFHFLFSVVMLAALYISDDALIITLISVVLLAVWFVLTKRLR